MTASPTSRCSAWSSSLVTGANTAAAPLSGARRHRPAVTATLSAAVLSIPLAALAGPTYQPTGATLVIGDVTHGQRGLSASSNPAGAAADLARSENQRLRGTVPSALAGLEYGNVQELFDLIDELSRAFAPSPPDTGPPPPGQAPGEKPEDGIDIGDIIDQLDPDTRAAIEEIAEEVATQATILGLIAVDGYARAQVSGEVPLFLGRGKAGGAWTLGLSWSGAARAFGIAEPIDFDPDAALTALEEGLLQVPNIAPVPALDIDLTGGVLLSLSEGWESASLQFDNDSSLVTKSVRNTQLNLGYSRRALSNDAGSLFVGGKARLDFMQLSRLSVRFGDITDSEELFQQIRNADFREDTRLSADIGALWVARRYQLGLHLNNINEPTFEFNEVATDRYTDPEIIEFLEDDRTYRLDAQLKLEASVFTANRRWAVHVGYDVDPVTDPLGDEFQWLTVGAGVRTDKWWLPAARIGWRQNLAGTELGYLGAGLTLFRFLNVEVASALDTVTIDGDELPLGLIGSVGFQFSW